MSTKIEMDHFNTKDQNHKFFNALGKMGFNLYPNETLHMGGKRCRFIFLENDQYLEFITTRNKDYIKKKPGLSFRSKGKLEKLYKSYVKKAVPSKYSHKNYNWKENSKDRLPGWNFIHFLKTPFRTVDMWITEYEGYQTKTKETEKKMRAFYRERAKYSKHPNTVYAFDSLIFEANTKSQEYLLKTLGPRNNNLVDKKSLVIKNANKNRMSLIILRCKSLKKASSYIKGELCEMHGREGIFIKNPSGSDRMWDLFVIEG